METCQRGMVDYTFLGGAQIDAYGNLNSTCVGPHARPKVRLPGSGGANDFASLCWRTLVLTLLLLAALAASACGNKGPLYLPKDKPPVAEDEDQTTPGPKK